MSLNVHCNKVFLNSLMLCYPFQLQLSFILSDMSKGDQRKVKLAFNQSINPTAIDQNSKMYWGLIHLNVQPGMDKL